MNNLSDRDLSDWFQLNFGARVREYRREPVVSNPYEWRFKLAPDGVTYNIHQQYRVLANVDIPADQLQRICSALFQIYQDEEMMRKYPQLREAWEDFQLLRAMLDSNV